MVGILRSGIRLLPVIAVILLVVEILLTNELAGIGSRVSRTDRTIDRVREENQLLREGVASMSSLLTIEEKSRLLGFTVRAVLVPIGREDVAFNLQQ